MKPQIFVCIPIDLKTRQDIASALVKQYGTDYLFLGRIFQAPLDNQSCAIEVCDRDSRLMSAFEIAGQDKIAAATLDAIDKHHQVIYLISDDTGYAACVQLAKFVRVFLTIGGIAVKIESAGIAHSAEKWLANYNSEDVFDLYSLYVVLVEGEDNYYSCGMHNFGKADVTISLTEDIGMAIYVMNVFNYYRLTESPILQDGHTFQPDIKSPSYQLKWFRDREYAADSSLHNPYGRWHLMKSNE